MRVQGAWGPPNSRSGKPRGRPLVISSCRLMVRELDDLARRRHRDDSPAASQLARTYPGGASRVCRWRKAQGQPSAWNLSPQGGTLRQGQPQLEGHDPIHRANENAMEAKPPIAEGLGQADGHPQGPNRVESAPLQANGPGGSLGVKGMHRLMKPGAKGDGANR